MSEFSRSPSNLLSVLSIVGDVDDTDGVASKVGVH